MPEKRPGSNGGARAQRAYAPTSGRKRVLIVKDGKAVDALTGAAVRPVPEGADDVMVRPLQAEAVHRRARGLARLSGLAQTHEALLEAYEATLHGFANILDLQDGESEGHTQRATCSALPCWRMVSVFQPLMPSSGRQTPAALNS